jgi:predicted O-methyltransferase YrrM
MSLEPNWIKTLFAPTEIAVESPWAGLIPVMNLMIDLCRPRRFVELGTYRGCSFFAALSAAKACGHAMQATAIDSWRGDAHSGFYEGEAFQREVEAGVAAIGMPADLLRQTFDEAVAGFDDGQIDLLHIDGFHSYEASMGDFQTWRPKLSARGVVLFHDIAVREADFGVWRTWAELSATYPHISFGHSNGLGILFTGPDIPIGAQPLLERWSADPQFAETLRLIARIAGYGFAGASGKWDAESASSPLDPSPSEPSFVVPPLIAAIERLRAEFTARDAAKDAAHAGALRAQQDDFEAERRREQARLDSLRGNLAELRQTNGRIRASRMWPLLRRISPLRKRLKHLERITERTQQLACAEAPPLPGADPNRSRTDLIEALPQIAESFRQHGMRPGHWVSPEVTKAFQKHGFTVVANTFYAVTPDLNALCDKDWRVAKYETAWRTVPLRPVAELLAEIAIFAKELTGIPLEPPEQEGRFYWNNPMFSPLDTAAYYGVIRSLQPRRILEVGSGYSTAVALMASERCGRRIEISCIEPYPSPFLRQQRRSLHALIERKIQDVDPLLFETLEPGDVLFIDSSHCSHLGSDLNVLMFDCIPRLKPGVHVHFHDIFLPCEYPRAWLEDIGIMWNEQYLLLAFLMSNKSFEVLWSSSNAGSQKRDEIAEIFAPLLSPDAAFLKNLGPYSGGSLWLRKTG